MFISVCLCVCRLSGFAPSTRRWTRLWTERGRTQRPSARGPAKSWNLPSPGRPRTPSTRMGDWKRRYTTAAGWPESPTGGRANKLSVCKCFKYWYWLKVIGIDWLCFRGVLKWPDGRIYTGTFKNGLEDGWVLVIRISHEMKHRFVFFHPLE